MKRKFFRALYAMFKRAATKLWKYDGMYYRLNKIGYRIATVQAPCPRCHKTQTSVLNKVCSDCVMEDALKRYRQEGLDELTRLSEETGRYWG